MNKNTVMLKQLLSVTINTKYRDLPPTEAEFQEEADILRTNMNNIYPVTDEEYKRMIKSLKADMVVIMDDGVFITDNDKSHQSWFPANIAEFDFYYWNRYKKYLEQQKGWGTAVTAKLDKVTNEIMDLLGNPNDRSKAFQRRGLLLGDVQSGKTANYTAICNKVADCGYKVIIVLAGMMENLRVQTQERLDAEFAGRQSKYSLDPKADQQIKNKPVGVGIIPPVKQDNRISCFTSVSTDFNKVILKSNDLTLKNLKGTAIFVVKKNKSILNNLHNWLLDNNADGFNKIDLPLLLIDDEADNASVNTQSEDKDPTAINNAIRNILDSFYQASYLGITATPFANIFIDPCTNEGKPDDLFPRHFIYALPAPTNYIGADAIFGCGDDEDWKIRHNALYGSTIINILNNEMENYFRFKHNKNLADELTELPSSHYEAMMFFLLANAIRDIRGDRTDHRSMLVNVSRFTAVQNTIADLVNEWLVQVKSDLNNFANLSSERALEIRSIKELKGVWDKHCLEQFADCKWEVFQQKYLYKAVAPIEVRAVNQNTGTASLNYFAYKENGLRVIAVGGNSLSRGLTLEGLCVSYFYRNTMMYDTLLQMGRWFGYRKNYEDLFRIWMAEDAVDWYGYITDATNELKIEIERMRAQNQTPEEFGLKVRQDPNSLIVTARNKMRTATLVSRPITVSGRLIETPRLKNRKEILEENERICKKFIFNIENLASRDEQEEQNAILWRDIPKKHIIELVRNFQSHPWHLAFQSSALSEYIEINDDMDLWDVAIPQGSVKVLYVLSGSKQDISMCPEERAIVEDEKMLKVSGTKVKVGSGCSTRIGLTKKQRDDAKAAFLKLHPQKHPSDSTYLIKDRKPILMIHVIKTKPEKDHTLSEKCPSHLFALGLGFPDTGRKMKTANYMVNINELKNWVEIEDEDYDDDDM